MLRTKSVYSPIEPKEDGLRILVTRFRGRGMRSSRYHVWMANLGPSEQLLRKAVAGRITQEEFAAEYRTEIFADGPIDSRNQTIKNHGQKFTLRLIKKLARQQNVTLMCHCDEDYKGCHRHILRRVILSGKV
jgi:uncharacterized protein YeaO (DUF488 family)